MCPLAFGSIINQSPLVIRLGFDCDGPRGFGQVYAIGGKMTTQFVGEERSALALARHFAQLDAHSETVDLTGRVD